ncbi:DMT family transporter [Ramlibacter humi]|uniref:EamA family transporter n=1 Tax=Ramlibacter humi TaxID=2530451 RepID=A0A4Z0C064_9BURK|nr:DMT family transporter [Ramlibacter humi]TFZ03920.1 EamA family transporter [Ramlibacter humi]
MPPGALALVVLAGLIHASWNIAAKKAGGDVRFATLTSVVLTIGWAPVGVWLVVKHVPSFGWREWAVIAASAVLHLVYYLTLLRGYRRADLTVVYPLARGSGPLLSSACAIALFGEHLSAAGAFGIVGVVTGVFLIAGGPRLWRGPHDREARARLRKGISYGLVTGAFIASYTVVDGYAVKVMLMSPLLLEYVVNALRLLIVVPMTAHDLPGLAAAWRSQRKYILFVGMVSPVSYVLVLYAMQSAPLSHVAPAREVSMLFAALIGGQLLGEGDRWLRLAGAALIAAGVMALAMG